MVGHLPLEEGIGVRVPGRQPNECVKIRNHIAHDYGQVARLYKKPQLRGKSDGFRVTELEKRIIGTFALFAVDRH